MTLTTTNLGTSTPLPEGGKSLRIPIEGTASGPCPPSAPHVERRTNWHQSGYRHRIFAGAVSVSATLALFALLAIQVPSKSRPNQATRITVELKLLTGSQMRQAPAPEVARDATFRRFAERSAAASRSPTQVPIPEERIHSIVEPPPPESLNVESTEPRPEVVADSPALPASSPLKLDATTIRRASAQSRGRIQRLAEESGQQLPNVSTSQAERLSAGVTSAAKAECLAPNAHGSLLSIPFIAYAAVVGLCK